MPENVSASVATMLLVAVSTLFPLEAQQSSVVLSTSVNPSVYGRPVQIVATVSPKEAGGAVTFYDGTTILGISLLTGGQATLSTILLAAGTRSLRAYYGGDGRFSSSMSPVVIQTVESVPGNGFPPAIPYSATQLNSAASGVVADFNGDGNADIAIAGAVYQSNGVIRSSGVVLLGNGDGTFQAPLNFPLDGYAIAAGDFNGDGKVDLVMAGGTVITMLPGNGDGTFLAPVKSTYVVVGVESSATSIAVADFNGDGKADIAAAYHEGIRVFLGKGDGTFQMAAVFGAPLLDIDGGALAIGDFNGDGKPDIAAVGYSSGAVFLGDGDGTFSAGIPFHGAGAGVAVGDLNGDGISDVVTGDGQVLLGKGDGTFQQAPSPFSSQGSGVTLADFDGDGNIDAAFLVYGSAVVFPGNGDGTFQSSHSYLMTSVPSPLGMPASFLASADFNGDGRADLASGFSILLASAGFATTTTLQSSLNPSTYGDTVTFTATVSPADVSGAVTFFDGTTDWGTVTLTNGQAQLTTSLLPAHDNSMTAIYTGDLRYGLSTSPVVIQTVNQAPSTVTLTPSANPVMYGQNVTVTATVSPSLATGTVTFREGDTVLRVVLLNAATASLLLRLPPVGTHSLTASYSGDSNVLASVSPALIETVSQGSVTTPTMLLSSAPNPVNYNQSVTLTAVLSAPDATGVATFYQGTTMVGTAAVVNGQASLTVRLQNSGTYLLRAVYGGDANYTVCTSSPIPQTVKTIPSSAFGPAITAKAGINPVLVADFNGDGISDIAGLTVHDASGTAGIGVQLGNGDGTFQAAITTYFDDAIKELATGDFNGDGIPDLAIIHGDGTVAILLGKGDGAFRLAADNVIRAAGNLTVADFNGDGKADLLVLTRLGLCVLEGNGDGSFGAAIWSPVPLPTSIFRMVVGDFNGDGIPDLAFAGQGLWMGYPYSNVLGTILGNGDGTFQTPAILGGDPFFAVGTLLPAAFTGDGLTDLIVQTFHGNAGHVSYYGSVLVNEGDGTFKGVAVPTGPYGASFVAADFNGDGIPDLIVNYLDSSNILVNVSFGNGDGTFQAPLSYSIDRVNAIYTYTLAGDFNGDGRLDLLGYSNDDSTIHVLFGCEG